MRRVKEILRASYDRSAAGYDAEFRPLQRPKYAALIGAGGGPIAGLLATGARAVDLGCGTGLLAEWLAAEGIAARGLVGLDLSPGMLAVARGRGQRVVEGDLDRLPFRDAAFTVALAFTALAILPGSPARALAEAARVLAPGGLLAITTLRAAEPGLDRELRAAGFLPGARRDCGQDFGWLCSRRTT
jgi:malonyl-CoA O-methyltransferase